VIDLIDLIEEMTEEIAGIGEMIERIEETEETEEIEEIEERKDLIEIDLEGMDLNQKIVASIVERLDTGKNITDCLIKNVVEHKF
jgi:hypothetical protein